MSPANLLQEGRCGQASAGRRGELQEFLVVPSGDMFLVLRKEAFIQDMTKGINRGAAGGRSRREAEVSEIQGFPGSLYSGEKGSRGSSGLPKEGLESSFED